MRAGSNAFLSFSQPVSGSHVLPRLYCFAYAGGAASSFAPWGRALAGQMTVLGVELPGHGSRFQEPPLEHVADMAESVAEAIRTDTKEGPFAFYGHSLGAVVAFETARHLEGNQGRGQASCTQLFVGAARAPHLLPVVPEISHLPERDFLEAVQNRYGGIPAAVFEEPELLALVLPILRADFKAYEDYRSPHALPLRCSVTAFHGVQDPVVRRAAVAEWARTTESRFQMHEMDGDHFFLNPCRDLLLSHIRNAFEDTRAASGPVEGHLPPRRETY